MQHLRLSFQSKFTKNYLNRPYDGELSDVWSWGVILYSMIEGTLPFDNENLCVLFKTIQQGKFKFYKTASSEWKDLINRMLQPNILKRITIEEVKSHSWFNTDLDSYLFDSNLLYRNNPKVIDSEILDKLIGFGLNINLSDENKIEKAIQNKENRDFGGVYQELIHEKVLSRINHHRNVS